MRIHREGTMVKRLVGKTAVAAKCAAGVCDPQVTEGLQSRAPNGKYDLVKLRGPGVFLGAQVTKQGGSGDITFVALEIDGRTVVNLSYSAAMSWSLTQMNPYGVVLLQGGGTKTITIGYPTPLLYKRSLKLSVIVSEAGVAQVLANVVHGGA
jgi:hypothetical protein